MPLFHANGLMNNTILPLRAGASIVLRPRFDLGGFSGVVERFQPTYFTAVPTVFARLMDAWDGRAETSSLRFVRTGAAPMSPLTAAHRRGASRRPRRAFLWSLRGDLHVYDESSPSIPARGLGRSRA